MEKSERTLNYLLAAGHNMDAVLGLVADGYPLGAPELPEVVLLNSMTEECEQVYENLTCLADLADFEIVGYGYDRELDRWWVAY